jgi:uncharacterized protein (DUF2344 family)
MKDYSKGKIYRLTCKDLDLVYYGSTIQTLEKRLDKHLNDYRAYIQEKEYSRYCSSFKLVEAGEVAIELIMDYPCSSKRELEELEQTYIENDDCVNHQRAFTTKEQRLADNRIHDKKRNGTEYRKEYNRNNREAQRFLLNILKEALN